jgi:hypothetical protein
MDLISLLVVLVVLGLVWYLVTTYVPMPAPVKTVITVIAVLILCIWLLQSFGLTHLSFPRR